MNDKNISLDLFHPKKAELELISTQYKDLKINGIEDKKGYEEVHKAQMTLRNYRVEIEKTRKAYTKQFDDAKKSAMELEKELVAIISPIEENLKLQKEEIDGEKQRIRLEEERKKQEELNNKIQKLAQYGVAMDLFDLQLLSLEEFNIKLTEAQIIFEQKEKERIENEEIERINKLKTQYQSYIILAVSLSDLEQIKQEIGKELDFSEFENEWNSKKEIIEFREQKEKLEKQLKDKEEQEKLEKQKKYKDFLKKNEGNYDGFFDKDGERILYKIVDTFRF